MNAPARLTAWASPFSVRSLSASVRATHGRWHRRIRLFLVSGQSGAGSELGDAIAASTLGKEQTADEIAAGMP